MAAGYLHLCTDIAGQCLDRIIVIVKGIGGFEPDIENLFDNPALWRLLGGKIIMQVGVGDSFGGLLQAGLESA